jgi:hypothetical protein
MRRSFSLIVVLALSLTACSAVTDTTTTSTTTATTIFTTSTVVTQEDVLVAALLAIDPGGVWRGVSEADIASMANALCGVVASASETAELQGQPDERGQLLVEIIVDAAATATVQVQWFTLAAALIDFPICDEASTEVLREAKAFLYEALE